MIITNIVYCSPRLGDVGILGIQGHNPETGEDEDVRILVANGQPCPHCVADWPIGLLDYIGKIIAEDDAQMAEFKQKQKNLGGNN